MRLLFGHDAAVGEWVASRIPHVGSSANLGPFVAIGVCSDKLEAGVVFHNYVQSYGNIEVTCAADSSRWLTSRLATGIMHYPFYQLGCQRVTALTPRKARPARQFLEKFGFRQEGVVRRGFGSDDMFVYGLLRSEWENARINRGRVGGKENASGSAAG